MKKVLRLDRKPSTINKSPRTHTLHFRKADKQFIIFLVAIAGFFSPFSASIYFPALKSIATSLGVTIELTNLTVTMYLIVRYYYFGLRDARRYSPPHERGGYVGLVHIGFNSANSLDPVISGLLGSRVGWRSIFLVSCFILPCCLHCSSRALAGNQQKSRWQWQYPGHANQPVSYRQIQTKPISISPEKMSKIS